MWFTNTTYATHLYQNSYYFVSDNKKIYKVFIQVQFQTIFIDDTICFMFLFGLYIYRSEHLEI